MSFSVVIAAAAGCAAPSASLRQREQQFQHAGLAQPLDRNGSHHPLDFGLPGRGGRCLLLRRADELGYM